MCFFKANIKVLRTLIILFILLSVCPSAISEVIIHGKVTDAENKPVEFVTVQISGTAIGTVTGLDGGYRLSCAERDTMIVTYKSIGYIEQKRTLIDAKGDLTLNVRLLSDTKQLGEVEVSEIKKQTGSMQKIDAGSYRIAADATGGSVESLLSTMSGVSSTNELSTQYSVRGGSYDENSVMINGMEVYRPQLISNGQQEGLSIINPDMVGAIGFSTGGFTAEYPDKMSSVLDITYRQPESFEGSLGLSLMGVNAAIGQSSSRFSQLHGFRYKRNSSMLSSMESKGEYDPEFLDYQTNLVWMPSKRFKASFLGNISVNNYRFTPVSRSTNFGTADDAKQFKVYFDGREKDKFETYFGALTLDYKSSQKTTLSLLASGFLTNELVTYDIKGEYWLDQAGTSGDGGEDTGIGGELGVGKYLEHARNRLKASVFSIGLKGITNLRNHSLTYGVAFRSEKIMDRSREWELRDSAGYSLPSTGEAVKLIYNLSSRNDINSVRFSGYLQDSWRVITQKGLLNLNYGLRFSHWSFNKELLISPRVNIGFVPEANTNWAFRFATGLYYQSPFYKEYRMPITDSDGNTTIELNKDIKSQRSLHFILGADYTFRAFGRPFKLSGEAYYKALSNLVPYEIDNLKIVYSGQNQTNGFTTGVDFRLFGQFVPGSDSWISLGLMKTQETLNGKKVPLPRDQRYNLALYFTDFFPKYPKLKFSLRGILSDGLPAIAPRSSRDKGYFRTPPYKRVDIGFAYGLVTPPADGGVRTGSLRWLKSAWIGVDVFNLFDISNVSSYYWVTDVNDIQYAVPNYLTRRQLNVRLSLEF